MNFFGRFFAILPAIAVLALCVVAFGGCGRSGNDRMLMVSIEPQRYLLQQIAGDDWNVRSLLDKNSDPENFDPSMSALKAASDCRAYFAVGQMAFEDELLPKLASGNDDMLIVDTSRGIELVEGHVHDDGSVHGHEVDPHTWVSVRNARTMAENMRDALVQLDPENAQAYSQRCERLVASLDSLDSAIATRLEPCKGDAFVVWHPSLSYFARDYGLHQISIGSENKELSPQAFRRRIDDARSASTGVLFVDAAFDGARAQEIAAQAGAECRVLNLTAPDWLKNLDEASLNIAASHKNTSTND